MEDLKLIKKHYGEKMSHLCRDLFPSILETEGLLFKILSNKFHYSKFLYDDLVENKIEEDFKEYIYSLTNSKERSKIIVDKNPYELMEEAGYTLYKCETESDIQSFKKYYAPDEEICTFHGGRLDTCHVFFAVKKNADELKRENFKNPKRQDEYGTSVISIQFSKGKNNYLSIKNRYNHTVLNPDATFSNNLENIIPGLTYSFEREFGYEIEKSMDNSTKDFEIPGYVKAANGKYYKYNYEKENIYYCADNIIIDVGEVIERYLDKNRYLVFDYFILDLRTKRVYEYFSFWASDSFPKVINSLKLNSLDIVKNKEGNKEIIFTAEEGKIIITIDKQNRMISYYDDINEVIRKSHYLSKVEYLKDVQLLKMKEVSNYFIPFCKRLKNFSAPLLEKAGDYFLYANSIEKASFPSLKKAGGGFMSCPGQKNYLKEINAPKLEKLGDNALQFAECLEKIYMPNVKSIGTFSFELNHLVELDLPNLESLGNFFMSHNNSLKILNVPKLPHIPKSMLKNNYTLEHVFLPSAKKIETNFLPYNKVLKSFIAPNVKEIEEGTILTNGYNKLPNLEHISLSDEVIVDYWVFLGKTINNLNYFFREKKYYANVIPQNKIKVGNIEGKEEINQLQKMLSESQKKVKKIEK